MSIPQVIEAIRPFGAPDVLVTGGEPLLQRATPALVEALRAAGYRVSIETHGEVPIAPVAGRARIVMDVKTPSSGMARMGFQRNLPLLQAGDEIKFVIASEDDYFWSRDLIRSWPRPLPCEILLSPAVPAAAAPGAYPGVALQWLAERMLEDRLPARMQIQLHKLIWGADRKGV